MSRWAKKGLLVVALLLALAAGLSGVGVAMFKGTPDWYRAGAATSDAERAQLARDAEHKLIEAQNWAATVRADEQRAARHRPQSTTAPAPRAEETHQVEFSQQEINALFDKWSGLYGWREKYGEFLEDPEIVLREGKLILVGRLRELGAVTSFQFRPQIDPQGRLRLDLVRVSAGRLPLPESVWGTWRDGTVNALRRHLPAWRARARIDPSGAANFPAMAATFSRLLFDVAGQRSAEPILFFPLADGAASVPVEVVEIEVADGVLQLKVEPLTPTERSELLQRIRSTPLKAQAVQAAGR